MFTTLNVCRVKKLTDHLRAILGYPCKKLQFYGIKQKIHKFVNRSQKLFSIKNSGDVTLARYYGSYF